MNNIPKSPQELSAQVIDAQPYFDNYLPEEDAQNLSNQAKAVKVLVETMRPYTLDDEELAARLTNIIARARASGVWQPTEGEGAERRLSYAVEKFRNHGYGEEEAAANAIRVLKKNGYVGAIKARRKEQERLFNSPVANYIDAHQLDNVTEKQEVESLSNRIIDITNLSSMDLQRLASEFPSGNFVYHGLDTQKLIEVMDSGALVNAMVLHDQEAKAAKAEGRETRPILKNSGFEGVSWSLNGIDALPGDRYHLAGFLAAPETILNEAQQLAVPSRPAPNEVIQIASDIEADDFYDAKTQFELYLDPGMLGETNSVFSNLLSVSMWEKEENRRFREEPMLYDAKNGVLARPDYQIFLRKFYSLESDGSIKLSPELLAQVDNEIPVATVWIQAAIDTGRLENTVFSGKGLPEIVDLLRGDNIRDLIALTRLDAKKWEAVLGEAEKVMGRVEVPVESMYLVAPHKDLQAWLKVIARSPHKPAGILLYDDKKVRLENFASSHRGDHAELTHELQTAISPNNKDYIDYTSVLGVNLTDDMRTGRRHQVIADIHLTNRGVVRKAHGKLLVER